METVYVSQIDTHTLFALGRSQRETRSGRFTAGARIDSPPTVDRGRVVFGCTDGWVYCLTTDGELVWRYRAAPLDRRTMAYRATRIAVAGSRQRADSQTTSSTALPADRSSWMEVCDWFDWILQTGKKLSETIMDEKNPETGNNIQEKLQILQMPVGLPDILSCDGQHIFMKSQKFDMEGNRLEIGPNSGDFATQASKQRGEDAHIFAPMGFLDDTWFHRSYWVLGQSFAGGHGGYYQAGRFAPSGRLLVNGQRLRVRLRSKAASTCAGRRRWNINCLPPKPIHQKSRRRFGKRQVAVRSRGRFGGILCRFWQTQKPGSDRQATDGRSLDHGDQTAGCDHRSRRAIQRFCPDTARW